MEAVESELSIISVHSGQKRMRLSQSYYSQKCNCRETTDNCVAQIFELLYPSHFRTAIAADCRHAGKSMCVPCVGVYSVEVCT